MIITAPIATFNDKASFKKITDRTIVNATLSLSTGATCETFPN
jgi:hypothetical protein